LTERPERAIRRSYRPPGHRGEEALLGYRRLFAAATVCCAVVLASSSAVAAGGNPGRTLAPPPDPYTALLCGAAVGDVTVSVDLDTYRSYVKTYTMSDGSVRLKFNGFQAATVQGNGKTLDLVARRSRSVLCNGSTWGAPIAPSHIGDVDSMRARESSLSL